MTKILFIVPALNLSGGTFVSIELAERLAELGQDVTIAALRQSTEEQRFRSSHLSTATLDDVEGILFDIAVVSFWPLVYLLDRIRARRVVYYVQSLESRFYPKSEVDLRRAAAHTYRLGLDTLTVADWLSRELTENFGNTALTCRYGISKQLFNADGPLFEPRKPGHLRVLIEGPMGVPLKNTDEAVAVAKRSAADEVWLLTSSPITSLDGVQRVFSRQSPEQVAAIMRSCDVLLKISFVEGQPLPPLEMALCGRPSIVSNLEPYHEYLCDGESGFIVSEPYGVGVLSAIRQLKREPDLADRMGERARAKADAWPSHEEAAAQFLEHIESIRDRPPTRLPLAEDAEYAACRSIALAYLDGERAARLSLPSRILRRIAAGLRPESRLRAITKPSRSTWV